jgi:hypothetical protein
MMTKALPGSGPEPRGVNRLVRRGAPWGLLVLPIFFVGMAAVLAQTPAVPRSTNFDFDWRFHLGDTPAAAQRQYDDGAWRQLDLPHDFSAEGEFSPTNASCTGYLPGGVGWYRKSFTLPESVRDKRVFVEFDGVQRDSDVWLNGTHLGHRPNGYISFSYELTPHLRFGAATNVLAVRVERENVADSRWYPGTGIYRDVRLTVVDALHFATWGTFVTTPRVTDQAADVVVNADVRNEAAVACEASVVVQLLDPDGKSVGESRQVQHLEAGQTFTFTLWQQVAPPRRWSLNAPNLYTAVCRVFRGEQPADETRTTFGIRTIRFDPRAGFFLNEVNLKLKGVCLHHDAGALGAAVPREVLERRLQLCRDMGVNAIRCSHNPMAPELYDLCDRLGLLVMDEAFDEWEIGKRKWVEGRNVGTAGRFGYSHDFAAWAATDCADMVRRDRNHPSIILWSLGNEIDYPTDPYVLDVTRRVEGFAVDDRQPRMTRLTAVAPRLIAAVKEQDPTRPVTMALANWPASDAVGLASMLDVVGGNYQEDLYAQTHRQFPGRALFGSENGKGYNEWRAVAQNDYVAGQFLWVGFDFLGEAGRWPNHGSSAGLFDTRGFLKPEGWQREALWSDHPVLHVVARPEATAPRERRLPARAHWNWGDSNRPVNVTVFSNCEAVELRVNGRAVATVPVGPERVASASLSYEPGTLEAVGRTAGGESVRTELRTAGAPARLHIELDRQALSATQREVAHAVISVVDDHGVVVPDAAVPVTVNVAGTGRLLGVDNGDLWDTTPLSSPTKRPRDGRLLAIIGAGKSPGSLRLQVSAVGLASAEVSLETTE